MAVENSLQSGACTAGRSAGVSVPCFWWSRVVWSPAATPAFGAGLAASYGKLMPKMEGGILYEHGHRMIATTVGLFTIVSLDLDLPLWTP